MRSRTHLHSGETLPISTAIWGTTYFPKVWFLMSTVFVKKKQKNMQHWLISTQNASLHSQKKGKIMSFSIYYVRKMTAITDKHCLQKVLILAVWDDVYQCLITVLRQFFKSICTTKCSDGGKKAFSVPWLQIITTQWTNICLVNISGMNYFLMIVMLFEFHRMLLFMSKSHSQITHQTWEKLLTGHPAGHRIWGTHNFTAPSGV